MGAPDLISGGYFLIRPIARAACFPSHLVRDPIVSASNCLQDECLPDFEWFSDKGDRKWLMETAPRLGLTEAEGDRIQAWVEAGFRASPPSVRWPNVFASIDALRELVSIIGRVPAGFIAIGIALPCELVPRMLTEPDSTKETEVWGQLGAALPPVPGLDLGWEVLGRETVENHMNVLGFHSWLCNGMEEDAEREFNITPNARGFIERYEDARKVAEYCDKIQPEPGVWLPWLITQYEI
ncbi:hypothetical protein PLCT2_00736 [Planctomycetaceae bacterium]|nr:hypothetical protein PLCT2_00736 [Planctomycetaceae bacterium]